ncbi:MAG: aconitate hydratase AcnA, partial [Betaproteobacteria bacterium]|nr:aconitate hydratase AcnA [Betaproteobacteria bacterium]
MERALSKGSTNTPALAELKVGSRSYRYCSLAGIEQAGVAQLPYTFRIVLENLLRQRLSGGGDADDVAALLAWRERGRAPGEIHFMPARVMMDDTAGIPSIGDLAAMRDAVARLGGDPQRIAPVIPLDFVVDHSVIADHAGGADALARNMALELKRNAERFSFLRWGGQVFDNLHVVPPGGGICHQVNLEYLARVVRVQQHGEYELAYPDSMVGIDSHTPMVNGLGIVGWGVSGMEGVAAALGEPVSMLIPQVVGCRLGGRLNPGVTATDLVLTITQMLRKHDVVGKFIEYFGPGLRALALADRATVANMTPEAGATMSYFPIDAETLRYLRATGRDAAHVALVEAYAKAQGLWHDETCVADYSSIMEIDLAAIEASVAGPRQPHERVSLSDAPQAFSAVHPARVPAKIAETMLVKDGDVVIAAITSCTNTSNPAGMIGAGIVARNAVARGLKAMPWVKTSLSPGSRVVADYLQKSGLQQSLDALGFQVAGFGCMTCVGFSGPLAAPVANTITGQGVATAAVLSGNRNYEGRIHPQVRASFLASPPLVVAYALAGSILKDLTNEPLGIDPEGRAVYLRDLWPDEAEIRALMDASIEPELYTSSYARLYEGSAEWQALPCQGGTQFEWGTSSTTIRQPPMFDDVQLQPAPLADICGARVLAIYGDLVTTEHVSPMGMIPPESLAGQYLQSLGVAPADFVSFAARRLNHDVMIRGTLASVHLHNEMTPGSPGGNTFHMPGRAPMSIYDAAQRYRRDGIPLVVIAGRGYGTGSSRDWSAKGMRLLGVRAVIAESFERIHRSNLVAAGVLPLQFSTGQTRRTLRLDGSELFDVTGLGQALEPAMMLRCTVTRADGSREECDLL